MLPPGPPVTSIACSPAGPFAVAMLLSPSTGTTNWRRTMPLSSARLSATDSSNIRIDRCGLRMIILHFFAMCGEQRLEGGKVDLAVRVQAAECAFEWVHGRLTVEDLDLGDQPIEPQADGGIGNAVRLRKLLQRSRGEHESLEEGDVFLVEQLDPMVSGWH